MKKRYTLFALAFSASMVSSQTITFKGCINLFEDQNFTFTKTDSDSVGKGIYITNPVDGNQACGGLGICEFKITWNTAQNRWEFLADDGNGDFANPYLIYYNATGNNSALNPPSATTGIWVENTEVTNGECGGNLSSSNSTMTGDVHTSTLSASDLNKNKIQFFPNPVKDILTVSGIKNAASFTVYNMTGNIIKSGIFNEKTDLSNLRPGVYIFKVDSNDGTSNEFKFIKK